MIILLSGWAGSGKDAAAELLVEEMGFERLAFADALKEEVSKAMQIPLSFFRDRILKDRHLESHGASPRELLIRHAAIRKQEDHDIYSRIVAAHIQERSRSPSRSPSRSIVISDWRYRHEYAFLKETLHDTVLVRGRITRASITPTDDTPEHDLDEEAMDFMIANDGSISDLRDLLKKEIRKYYVHCK